MTELLRIPGETKLWTLKRHRILGRGSFGCATLYEEVDVPGSFVVVKDVDMQTMKKSDEMKALEMEVRILRGARMHPNIVHFLDYYHDGGFMVYIVMEYCAGGDLARLEEALQRSVSSPPEDFVASVLTQVLVGLNFLHVEQHTLHRDIKPQNIFLCSDSAVRIGDFGVSTILEHAGSTAKGVCGSPFYMAPELCEERAYDGKADIWSLGVMLYELMLLERPFRAASGAALARQITRGEYTPIPVDGRYSPQLIELVHSFLHTSTTTRSTLRRALRSSYVQSRLACVPASCLNTPYYTQLFGEEHVQNAIKHCRSATAALGSGVFVVDVANRGGDSVGSCDGNDAVSNNKNGAASELSSDCQGGFLSQPDNNIFASGDAVDKWMKSERTAQQLASSCAPRHARVDDIPATAAPPPCVAQDNTKHTVSPDRNQQTSLPRYHCPSDADDSDEYGDYEDDFDTDDSCSSSSSPDDGGTE